MKAQSELARRAFGNGKANGGYVIIAVLVLMALLSVQSLFVWKIIKRMAGVLQVETAALSAESLARADVWQLLSSVDQEEFPLDSILNLRGDSATFVRTGPASVVMLNGRASYLGVKRRESVLVSIRSTSEEKPVLPNWGELFDNLKGASDVCTRWARATTGSKEGSENRSSRTCVGFASNLSQGGVIMGNLEGLEPVYV
ncbi:MAG: hypothetical protein IT291_00185, partial [Deltaproteobacteria bacterium]|nr:hypothetical protein [Deltaproteobacteria bacterium]